MSMANIEKMDRRIKWALLVVSVLSVGFLAAAALLENVFTPWRIIRSQYAHILQDKATDERGQTLADQFQVRVAQNYVPALGAVDRCVTCHPGIDDPRMANEKQPYRAHPGDYLAHHPSEQFGCTICHHGQGRALVFEEAKAEGHHWDSPLLPANLTQSSCGQCHTADEVAGRGGEKYAYGKQLFESKGCNSCHKLDGRGGNMGPALDGVGSKIANVLPMVGVDGPHTLSQWLAEHFRDPQKVVAGSLMKPPQLSEEEIEGLTVYMLSLQKRDLPQNYLTAEKNLEIYKKAHPDAMSGEQLFQRFCSSCHDTGEYGPYSKFYHKFFPAVRGSSFMQTASVAFVEETIRQGRPGTQMPAWNRDAGGLQDEEIARIADYLTNRTLTPEDRIPEAAVSRARDAGYVARGTIGKGGLLYGKHCSSCHTNGLGPDLTNPALQKAASDGFLFASIAYGRRNTAMPGFLAPDQGGFSERDVEDLVTFIRLLGGGQGGGQEASISMTNVPAGR